MYTVNHFVEKFEQIPEENWALFVQTDHLGRRCASGFCCLPGKTKNGHLTPEGRALHRLFKRLPVFQDIDQPVSEVNDRPSVHYPQTTSKQRILAALYDIQRLELAGSFRGLSATRGHIRQQVGNTNFQATQQG